MFIAAFRPTAVVTLSMSQFAESWSLWFPGLLVMLGLVSCSAFFSASETAFFFLSREEIRRFSAGNRRQRTVSGLMQDPDRLLTAVLFWNLLINLGYFSIGIVMMQSLTRSGFTLVASAMGIFSLLGMIVLGEVTPKTLAVLFRQQISVNVAWPLATAVRILDPVIPTLNQTAVILRRTFWPHVQHEPHLQPEDLEKAIDASAAYTSELLEIEQKVLHSILDLNEVLVEEVMRPRGLCVTAEPDDTLETHSLGRTNHVSYVMVKDDGDESDIFSRAVSLVRVIGHSRATFAELSEPVIYVPWCATLAFVLGELRNRYSSVVIVVHEHGEMVGSLCYDDILEVIFTEGQSRTRRVLGREPLLSIGDNRYHAEGLISLRLLYQHLRISFDAEEENLNTLSGLFQDELERLPVVGDQVEVEGWQFTAIAVDSRGRLRALVEPVNGFPVEMDGE